jgi:hypothetical protein
MIWLPEKSDLIGKITMTGFLLLLLFSIVLFLNRAIRGAAVTDLQK